MPTVHLVYDQLADLIAQLEPAKLLALRASEDMQSRFDALVQKQQEDGLDAAEKDELAHFVVLERLFRLAKIKAERQANS